MTVAGSFKKTMPHVNAAKTCKNNNHIPMLNCGQISHSIQTLSK